MSLLGDALLESEKIPKVDEDLVVPDKVLAGGVGDGRRTTTLFGAIL